MSLVAHAREHAPGTLVGGQKNRMTQLTFGTTLMYRQIIGNGANDSGDLEENMREITFHTTRVGFPA
jgi:hypothetical protein